MFLIPVAPLRPHEHAFLHHGRDGRRFRYDENNYLVLSAAPLRAPPRAAREVNALTRGVTPAPLDAELLEVATRLLRCLLRPMDARVLGESIVNELIYRVLLGPHGPALTALAQHHTPYARVARALAIVHRQYAAPLNVEALAREAAMSPSAFLRAFKRITGESPLQYVKKIRLNKARTLLVHGGLAVSAAAYQVGDESPSQFSREFKRYFSTSPSQARASGYAELVGA